MSVIEKPLTVDGARVEHAALWLDERYPGWAQLVNLAPFDMDSHDMCVGGQIGVHWEDLRDQYVKDTGNVGWGLFAGFEQEWRAEIRARQG